MKIKPSREQQEYLIDRWAPIVEAAGIDVRGKTAFDIYLLAGKVLNDPELFQRRRAAAEGTILADSVPIIEAMTAEEKAALRKRLKV